MIIRKGVVRMTNIRFWISKISIYVFVYCALFLIQRALLLLFFDVKQFILFDKIYAYEIILSIIGRITQVIQMFIIKIPI